MLFHRTVLAEAAAVGLCRERIVQIAFINNERNTNFIVQSDLASHYPKKEGLEAPTKL